MKTVKNKRLGLKHELKTEFLPEFEKQTGIEATVGIMTGDNKIDPNANVVVMTTEILRNSLYKVGEEGKTRKKR